MSIHKGIGLSTERLNKILQIDEQNLQVIKNRSYHQVLREAVAEKNLFYPPDPSSQGSCWMEGTLLKMRVVQERKIWCD